MPAAKPTPDKPRPDKNMELWNSVCETPPDKTKEVTYGRGFTTVDPQYRIKRATELWGPFGGEWTVNDCRYDLIKEGETILLVSFSGILVTPHGEQAITSDAFFRNKKGVIEDIWKSLYTDALTKGLSRMGFNSDVHEGMYDDDKYVKAMRVKFKEAEEKPEEQTVADKLADNKEIIAKRLHYLSTTGWDGFDTSQRRGESIKLHLGEYGLNCTDTKKQEAYAEHLREYCNLAKAGEKLSDAKPK